MVRKTLLKKTLGIMTAIIMSTTMIIGCSETSKVNSSGGSGGDTIKLGGVFPLTGDVPALGAAMENGAKLAIKEINANGGVLGKKLDFVVEDDQDQAATAPNAITKLINQDKVSAVIGTYASKCSIPMAAVAKDSKVVMITPGSTNEKVTTEGGDYVFRACFIDPLQGKVGAQFASQNLKAKKVAMLYDVGNDYCVGISKEFKSNFEAAGGTIAYEKTYNAGESDFKAFLTEIKDLNVDVLYLPDNYSTVGLIAKQAREIGINAALLGSDSWSDPGLIKVGGDAVEGAYFTDHVSLKSDNATIKKFVENYKKEYNSDPSAFSVLSYDSVYIVAEAIKKAGSTDEAAIKDAMAKLDVDAGTTHYKFDDKHNPIKSVVINKVVKGEFNFETEISAK
ncbi:MULTISPECIES: ABC transporter substrate-binding protein [unclassified Clostridium]|uniref:ABC transporter substrate-binding protein n=1 Tax=unclassified Clostridium TaxID=2614128 RepID=UPI0002982E64|nr:MULTISPECIES: ABC transporter substrate-binding protein [unclassified Clostridium]EKQ51658.1 MAG: ABC-type branched-chain amino acid transport system, periplasmic component [Clostridium sp. Maddingley MBC34-26]